MPHDLRDRAIAEQAHPDHEPDDERGRKFPPPQRRLAGRRQCLVDPFRINRFAKLLEARRTRTGADGENGLPHLHRPTSRGGDQLQPVDKKIQIPDTYALSDRHWG